MHSDAQIGLHGNSQVLHKHRGSGTLHKGCGSSAVAHSIHDKGVDYVPYDRPAKEGVTMQHKLDLYYYDECPYCQKVLRAMRRLGIEDEITLKNILRSQEAADTLVRVGGKRQVPCLFIDGDPLYESDDIVAYLERAFA